MDFGKIHKEICNWLTNPDNKRLLLEQPTGKISEHLSQGFSPSAAGRCASNLGNIAVWIKNQFLADLWNQSDSCCKHGALMLDYEFWSLNILYERHEQLLVENPNFKSIIGYQRVCPLMALLMSFGRMDQARWIGTRLIRAADEGHHAQWLDHRDFSAFMLALSRLIVTSHGSIEPQSIQGCGVYDGLFRNWSNPGELQHSIQLVCDDYLLRTKEANERKLGILEFVFRPYNVIPVAVLAYMKVREMHGMQTDLPNHMLLGSRYVSLLPSSLPSVQDALLDSVVNAASTVFPKILDL